jgi:hypothetical protein
MSKKRVIKSQETVGKNTAANPEVINLDLAGDYIKIIIKQAMVNLCGEDCIKKFLEEHGIKGNELLDEINSVEIPILSKKTASATSAEIDPEELNNLKSDKFNSGFIQDGKHCVYFFGGAGSRKFQCCGIKCGSNLCPTHKRNESGKKLEEKISGRGFNWTQYCAEKEKARLTWVANKEKAMNKKPDGKISISAPIKTVNQESSDSSSSSDSESSAD